MKDTKHDWDGQYGKDENKDLWYWCIYCGKKFPLAELDYQEREDCSARIKKKL